MRAQWGLIASTVLLVTVTLTSGQLQDFSWPSTVDHCGTQFVFERHMAAAGKLDRANSCATKGQCDVPELRYASKQDLKEMQLVIHVFTDSKGNLPDGVTMGQVQQLFDQVQQDYASYGISWTLTEIAVHENTQYFCLPKYNPSNDDWFIALEDMKQTYAIDPKTTLNMFLSCQESSIYGTLLGIATFPWDPAALTSTGGLWLNAEIATNEALSQQRKTAQHEIGHCLGLWHTFHGVEELPLGCNSACYESVHYSNDYAANSVGDFCADTPATPKNYDCGAPNGTDCTGTSWGITDFTNIMGYSREPQPCRRHFSTEQMQRMHCWTCEALPGWVQNGAC